MLMNALAPEMRVKRVVYQGIGQCEEMKQPEVSKVPTQKPKTNFPPMPRNQVDHINATVGQLLVYKVPDVSIHPMRYLSYVNFFIEFFHQKYFH